MQVKQSEYEFAKNLLQLFKQRSKQIPHINHSFESLVLSSHLKQEYLEITDRIGLTKRDTTNNLADLMRFAKETAKYGLKVHYLEDINKSVQERLRSYFIDLNKYLKELCDTSANIWNCFKKLKNTAISVRYQKQQMNSGLGFYLNRLKQFKQDVQNNKYSIIKTDSLSKTENITNRLQEIKVKLLSIYHSLNNDTPFIIKKKELRDYQIDTVLDEIQKKVNDKAQSKAKEFYVNCFVKVLQCRQIHDLKQTQKDILYTTKKNEELLLKRALKLYIQDEIEREKQALPPTKSNQTGLSLTPLSSNQNILNLGIPQTQKLKQLKQSSQTQVQQLKKEIAYLKQLIKKNQQNQINYQSQISILTSQLQNQSINFGFFDRSELQHQEEENQLIPYEFQEDTTIYSSEINVENQQSQNKSVQTSIIEQFPPPMSSHKVDALLESMRNSKLFEIELKRQIRELAAQNNQLSLQIVSYQNSVAQYKNRVRQEQGEKERYQNQAQKLLITLRQTQDKCQLFCAQLEIQSQNFQNEKQSYFQTVQKLSLQNDELKNKINELQSLKSTLEDKIEQLSQTIESLSFDTAELNDDLNLKIKALQVFDIEVRQLRASLEHCRELLQIRNLRNKQMKNFILKLMEGRSNQCQKTNKTAQMLLSNIQLAKIDSYFVRLSLNSQQHTDVYK